MYSFFLPLQEHMYEKYLQQLSNFQPPTLQRWEITSAAFRALCGRLQFKKQISAVPSSDFD